MNWTTTLLALCAAALLSACGKKEEPAPTPPPPVAAPTPTVVTCPVGQVKVGAVCYQRPPCAEGYEATSAGADSYCRRKQGWGR